MMRGVGRFAAMIGLLVLMAWPVQGLARGPWQQVRSTADNFEATFPGKPAFASTSAQGRSLAIQDTWAFNIDDTASYQLAAISYPPGTLPAVPTMAYYARLAQAYAHGSKSTLRSQYQTTIAGHLGAEAVFDDATGADLHHLLDVVVVGSRLYMIASAGPGAHEASSEALRFRNSFRLLGP